MEDKRAFERFDLKVPIKMRLEEASSENAEFTFTTSNICAGGAFFRTDSPIPEGTRVYLDFVISIEKLKELLDSQCRVVVGGRVVRREGAGIAIRFDEDYEIIPVKGQLH